MSGRSAIFVYLQTATIFTYVMHFTFLLLFFLPPLITFLSWLFFLPFYFLWKYLFPLNLFTIDFKIVLGREDVRALYVTELCTCTRWDELSKQTGDLQCVKESQSSSGWKGYVPPCLGVMTSIQTLIPPKYDYQSWYYGVEIILYPLFSSFHYILVSREV